MQSELTGVNISLPNGEIINFSNQIFWSILVLIILSITSIVLGKKIEKQDHTKAPNKMMLYVEIYVNYIKDNFMKVINHKDAAKYLPLLGSLFAFLMTVNYFGLLGLDLPPTDISFTLSLAIVVFVFAHSRGIKQDGFFKYIGGFGKPIPLLFPLEIVSALAKPISMAFRLFGNLLSGYVLLKIALALLPKLFGIISIFSFVQPFFNLYFDFFAGFIQALVFTTLTAVSISQAIESH